MKYILKFCQLFCLALLLTSCCENCPPAPGTYANRPCGQLMDSLYNQGVLVIARGNTLRLILPSDTFFLPASTKINPDKTAVFATIAELAQCQCYGLYPIKVYGYSDNVNTISSQKQRSYQQAHAVAALLWSNEIAWERMQVRGFGARGTNSSNQTPLGSAYNRRVEILIP